MAAAWWNRGHPAEFNGEEQAEEMPTLIIDGKEISVQPGATIMEAARLLGIYIPHFCYHPKLSIAGNCRMCLVEVEKMPKPVISCAMPVNEGMVVQTNSDMVKKSRKGVMEFLLINHPLDCPVCDQGGECSLQDLAMKYGPDRSRYHEEKRNVPDYDLGPLIETEMNRCIHCTRCIRFSTEITGLEEMGAVFRGDHMRVGPYIPKPLSSELTGNLSEICPVGALNNKPFHFQARGWEVKGVDAICVQCSVGCHVRLDHIDNQVKRVMVRHCDSINQTWICDKGRFSCDAYGQDRLQEPMLGPSEGQGSRSVTWAEALDRAAELIKRVKPGEVAGLASDSMQGAEELFAFQDFLRTVVGSNDLDHRLRQRDFRGDDALLTRADLMMNTSLVDLRRADLVVLVGSEPRFDVPLLNLPLRQATLAGVRAISITPRKMQTNLANLTEMVVRPGGEVDFLGAVLQAVGSEDVSASTGSSEVHTLAKALKAAKRPAILLGEYAVNHPHAESIRRLVVALLDKVSALGAEWNGFNRVVSQGNAAAAQDLGVVPHRGPGYKRLDNRGRNAEQILRAAAAGEIKVLLLLGCDPGLESVDTTLARAALKKAQVIYIGAQRSSVTESADVVLPGLLSAERSGTYTNGEGRAQRSQMAVMGPLQAKEDWRILRALSDRFAQPLAYNTREALQSLMGRVDHRYALDGMEPSEILAACDHSPVTVGLPPLSTDLPAGSGLLLMIEPAFYRSDALSRRSAVLTQLHKAQHPVLDGVRINPNDASKQKIQTGQRVRLIQGERSLEMTAEVDGSVPENVLFAHSGYASTLVQDLCDWMGGFPQVSLVGL